MSPVWTADIPLSYMCLLPGGEGFQLLFPWQKHAAVPAYSGPFARPVMSTYKCSLAGYVLSVEI